MIQCEQRSYICTQCDAFELSLTTDVLPCRFCFSLCATLSCWVENFGVPKYLQECTFRDVQFNIVSPGFIDSSTRFVKGFMSGRILSGIAATTPSYSFKTSCSLNKETPEQVSVTFKVQPWWALEPFDTMSI